jgi:hypothetical protein
MALLGFVSGLIFYDRELKRGLTKEEKMYLDSFCRALKEGKYKVKSTDEDE